MNASTISSLPPTVVPTASWKFQSGPDIYVSKEVELTPIGRLPSARRRQFVTHIVSQLASRLPSAPRSPEREDDVFTRVGRIYVEMNEFVELALPTCVSGGSVAWCFEAALQALSQALPTRTLPLATTPSDYNDYRTDGVERAHSTGCHINLLSTRRLNANEQLKLVQLMAPLNAIFGAGGLSFDGGLHFCDDPRASRVDRIAADRAHGEVTKPMIMLRDEPFADRPHFRLQVTGFASPRSPVGGWLQVDLVSLCLRAVLANAQPPWLPHNPLQAIRASPHMPISVRRGKRGLVRSMTKFQLAMDNLVWLLDFAAEHVSAESKPQIDLLRATSLAALEINTRQEVNSPVFLATDIAIKRVLFDRIAQLHKFDDFSALARASKATSPGKKVRDAIDALVVADVLFCASQDSTYEAAHRAGLFVKPAFAEPVRTDCLPEGVCLRDRARAELIASGKISFCNWDHYVTREGEVCYLQNPWSHRPTSPPCVDTDLDFPF